MSHRPGQRLPRRDRWIRRRRSGRSSARPACWRPARASSCWRCSWARSSPRALQGQPDHPWYAIGANFAELCGLIEQSGVRAAVDAACRRWPGYRVGIVGSLWLLGLVALIGIPVGVGAGVYLEEYAPPGRLRRIVQTNIANLAGVPSIVYGILGLASVRAGLRDQGPGAGPDACWPAC